MYRFITDTPSGLSQAQAQQIGVDELVASFVRFGDEQFRETLDITLEEFHAKFKNTAAFPTTSAPWIVTFGECRSPMGAIKALPEAREKQTLGPPSLFQMFTYVRKRPT